MRFLLIFVMLLCITGCDFKDAGLNIDLSNLSENWQSWVIGALAALLTKSKWWPFVKTHGQSVANLLRALGVLKKSSVPDATPDELTPEELIAIAAELLKRTANPVLKDQLLLTIETASKQTSTATAAAMMGRYPQAETFDAAGK